MSEFEVSQPGSRRDESRSMAISRLDAILAMDDLSDADRQDLREVRDGIYGRLMRSRRKVPRR